ncbi:hypothetical protein [Nonomuraea jabiensis]|uniref:hypothetical protein n=1 Tax=Nonomuraea jabiensis TaxID=882448 RepID=UPI0036B20342
MASQIPAAAGAGSPPAVDPQTLVGGDCTERTQAVAAESFAPHGPRIVEDRSEHGRTAAR